MAGSAASADSYGTRRSITAPGVVVYKMKDGTLVDRNMNLEVPARGQGAVVLTGGTVELRSEKFRTEKRNGRTIFSVEFADVPGAPPGTEMLLEGSYLKDKNRALYYGDIYGRNSGKGDKEWSHTGGFMFKAPVK
jgi:hypothetical protein